MFSSILRREGQTFGVFLEIFSCPISDITEAGLVHGVCYLSFGNFKNPQLKQLVNECRVSVKSLFRPSEVSKSNQKGFLITGQVSDYFGVMSLQAVTLDEFCDSWGDTLKKVYGTETCGYKPSYPNPRSMLLDKFVEAYKNNEILWHEQ